MVDRVKRWLRGEGPRPSDVPAGPEPEDPYGEHTSYSIRPVRMTEPVNLTTTPDQHVELLRASGATDRSKAEIIRAALTLALPTLVNNPHMIDLLQPGHHGDHNKFADADPGRTPKSRRSDNEGAE